MTPSLNEIEDEDTKNRSGSSEGVQGDSDEHETDENTNTVSATAEPADVDVTTMASTIGADEKCSQLADALGERLDERNEILSDQPTDVVDASLRPDIETSEGEVEVFSEEADEDAVQRFHNLDTEIATLLLDNQQLVIETLRDHTNECDSL